MKGNNRYEDLVKELGRHARVKKVDGYECVIKPIPGIEASGRLDPRVYEVQLRGQQAIKDNPMPQLAPGDPGFIGQMRAMMGWENKDITASQIETEFKTITGTYGDIPLRIYKPSVIHGQKRPAVVFFHGGGFIGGSVDVVENPCKALAEKAEAVVVSVDYRLAPEHPFPAGVTDCFESVKWVYDHAEELGVDPSFICVSGDSAGGNMAAVCSLMDRDQGTDMIRYQALIYPTVNMAGAETEDFRWSLGAYDIREHEELIMPGLMGMKGSGDLIPNFYLPEGADKHNPYFSPLLAENLSRQPETLIIAAEYDYLRIEDEAYAAKLARFGVPTRYIRYNGMDHAFLDKTGLYPQAEDCLNEISKDIRRLTK